MFIYEQQGTTIHICQDDMRQHATRYFSLIEQVDSATENYLLEKDLCQ